MNVVAVTQGGAPGQPTIVFLHGTGTSGQMWSGHLERFADHHCLAPDLPGHGASAQIPWRSLADTAERVADIIKTRATGGRAHILGLSLGGQVGYLLMARHPDLVGHTVIDGAAVVPSRLAPLLKAGVSLVSPFLHRRPVIRGLANMVGVQPADVASFEAELLRVRPRAFRRAFADAQDPGVLDDILCSRVRTLLVSGERELNDVHAVNAALADLMPHAQARVAPSAGHGWIAAMPELHARMVRAWIQDQPLPAELGPEAFPWRDSRIGHRIDIAAARLSSRRRDGGEG